MITRLISESRNGQFQMLWQTCTYGALRASKRVRVSECATYMGIVFSKFKQTQSVNISNGWLIITIVITPWAKLRISSTASNPFFMNSFSYTQEIVQLHICKVVYATPKAWMRLGIAKCPQPPRRLDVVVYIFVSVLRASAEGGGWFSAALQWFCKSAFKGI